MLGKRVKVLIVDDSVVMRKLLASLLSEDPGIEVVDTAPDPLVARDKIKELNPDVVTLDVEMPKMDGLTFLRKIMTLRPMPVVMVSTRTQAGADTTLEALEIGAVDFVAKPGHDAGAAMAAMADELRAKVKMAAGTSQTSSRRARATPSAAARPARLGRSTGKIITIGASTGGVEALKVLLMGMPEDTPPILVAQHMPERFTEAFAARLNRECPMRVCEASHNQRIEQGHVYIAPGSHHLELGKDGIYFACKLSDGERVSGHKPSVDVLFRSAAKVCGPKTVAAILTGMGKDGAEGMYELRQAKAITLGQDESSSLVYGMPRAAFERGGVMRQYPLSRMADAIIEACCNEGVARKSA